MGVQRGGGNFKPRRPGRMDIDTVGCVEKGRGYFSFPLCGGYEIFFGMILHTGILVNVFLFCRVQNTAVQALPQHG